MHTLMDEDILIRKAIPSDSNAMHQIWQAEMENALPGFDTERNFEQYFLNKIESQSDTFMVWIAEHMKRKEIMGWMALSPFINNPAIRNYFAEASSYVKKEWQGTRVGSALAAHAFSYAEEHSSLIAFFGIIHSGNAKAIALAKARCMEIGTVPAFDTQPQIPELKIFACRVKTDK